VNDAVGVSTVLEEAEGQVGLKRARQADHGAHHPGFGAIGLGVSLREILEKAAIAGGALRADRPDRCPKANRGAVDHGPPFDAARIGREELGGEIVGAFDDHVDRSDEFSRVFGEQAGPNELDPGGAVYASERVPRGVELVSPDVALRKQDLPVEIRDIDRVVVHEHDATHAGPGERKSRRAAEPADADDQNAPACRPTRRPVFRT
jgi:hypothetical protein